MKRASGNRLVGLFVTEIRLCQLTINFDRDSVEMAQHKHELDRVYAKDKGKRRKWDSCSANRILKHILWLTQWSQEKSVISFLVFFLLADDALKDAHFCSTIVVTATGLRLFETLLVSKLDFCKLWNKVVLFWNYARCNASFL